MPHSIKLTRMLKFCKAATLATLIVLGQPFSAKAACSVSSTTILFGGYDIFSTAPLDTLGQIVYRCNNSDHNISISLNQGSSSTFDPRHLINGSSILNYNLYLDAARTTIWGDGTGGTQNLFVKNPPNNQDTSIPVYGRIPAGQTTKGGNYSDSLTLTINY